MVDCRWAGDLPSRISSFGVPVGQDRDWSGLQLGCGQPHGRLPCIPYYSHMPEYANHKVRLGCVTFLPVKEKGVGSPE
jgi:hypothetical protein